MCGDREAMEGAGRSLQPRHLEEAAEKDTPSVTCPCAIFSLETGGERGGQMGTPAD